MIAIQGQSKVAAKAQSRSSSAADWSLTGWRGRPALQMPVYADAATLAVLTDEQRTKLDELKGNALEVDASSLQRGRGGFGGGRRGRGNDNDDAETESAN